MTFMSFTNIITLMFIALSFGFAVRQYADNKKVSLVAFAVTSAFVYMWMQVAHFANWYDHMMWENYGERPEPLINWGNMSDTVLRAPIYIAGVLLLWALLVRMKETRRKNLASKLLKQVEDSQNDPLTVWEALYK